jgi:hypothetical protein
MLAIVFANFNHQVNGESWHRKNPRPVDQDSGLEL